MREKRAIFSRMVWINGWNPDLAEKYRPEPRVEYDYE